MMNRRVIQSAAVLAIAAIFLVACAFEVQPVHEAGAADGQMLEIEVAENAMMFTFDEAPVFDDGMPAYGNPFVTKGYIYPPGTLTCDADGSCNGVTAEGEAEFPDQVIGTWYCRGYMIGDGARTQGEPWTFSTQMYDLVVETPGAETVILEGYESPDIGQQIMRAITGGTGPYAGARGQAEQTLLGFNATEGVSLSLQFDVAE